MAVHLSIVRLQYGIVSVIGQAKGKELEYRIIAVNNVSEGEPSNTEMVVL